MKEKNCFRCTWGLWGGRTGYIICLHPAIDHQVRGTSAKECREYTEEEFKPLKKTEPVKGG